MKTLFLFLACVSPFITYSQTDPSRSAPEPDLEPFYHGVASGDPLTDRVILWTKITTDSEVDVEVAWEIGEDPELSSIVNSGTITTGADRDFTIKVDATGLEPDNWYYFRFIYDDKYSLTGRTKTLPSGSIDNARFAVVSCSNYMSGYFTAYRAIGERNDLDAVIHLGDYIYEYETGGFGWNEELGQEHEPDHEILALDDYRLRHSYYKLDPDLRFLHQQYPMIVTWDDHEYANDAYQDGAQNHSETTEGSWEDRKEVAYAAYLEWMPVRETTFTEEEKIFRSLPYGDLLKIMVLDTRIYGRDEQVGALDMEAHIDTNRHIIGPEQQSWLEDEMLSNTSSWNVLAQQVMMTPLTIPGGVLNTDQWDGYQADRTRFFNFIDENEMPNTVILTGDIHSAWANDVPISIDDYNEDTGEGSATVEFVATSITSPGIDFPGGETFVYISYPHIKYVNLSDHGYVLLDVTHEQVQGDYYFVETITEPESGESRLSGWYVNQGETFLRSAEMATIRETPSPLMPPEYPAHLTPSSIFGVAGNLDFNIINVQPNPMKNFCGLQFFIERPGEYSIVVHDLNGAEVYRSSLNKSNGIHHLWLNTSEFAPGPFLFSICRDGSCVHRKVIKVN